MYSPANCNVGKNVHGNDGNNHNEISIDTKNSSLNSLISYHDVPRAMHFCVLLRGRKPVGPVFTNAVNVHSARHSPLWSRRLFGDDDHSVHAEARAAQRAIVVGQHRLPSNRRARKNQQQSAVGAADGLIVARYGGSGGQQLMMSMPCLHCANLLASLGFKFVVYSTGDSKEQWRKVTLEALLRDPMLRSCATASHRDIRND